MMTRLKVMTVFGTRPEAIKMAPVVQALAQAPAQFESVVCVTAQHREMLDQVLDLFHITPDIDLNVMQPDQDLFDITDRVLLGMRDVLRDVKPDIVLVHGDTTTTMATSLACYYSKIPLGHVEAGLRTFNPLYPFPEEINRVVTDHIATLCFAPTERSRQNLLAMKVPETAIVLTGNTVIDALLYTLDKLGDTPLPIPIAPGHRMVLVTIHRRENFGEPMVAICGALKTLVDTHADIELVLPVHPNPNVHQAVHRMLGGIPRIHLIEPMEYAGFCQLMAHAYLILTDSGGIQEEAPSLKKPVLVLRDETERPEAVDEGVVKLVGPHPKKILEEANRLLTDPLAYGIMALGVNPYGDGQAATRICNALATWANRLKTPEEIRLS